VPAQSPSDFCDAFASLPIDSFADAFASSPSSTTYPAAYSQTMTFAHDDKKTATVGAIKGSVVCPSVTGKVKKFANGGSSTRTITARKKGSTY
jgi:hypothetical protein